MNLFWKIWLGFWLSLLLMALGSITMVRLYDEERQQNPDQISDSKRVGFILEGTATSAAKRGAYGALLNSKSCSRPRPSLPCPLGSRA